MKVGINPLVKSQLPIAETDLEAEIDTLREVDTLRNYSADLRDEGVEILTALLENDAIKDSDLWAFVNVSTALWELSSDSLKKLEALMGRVGDLELKEILEFQQPPILFAAGILRTLTAAPGFAFAKASPYCYYLIIRELYTADAPNWAVGGARATLEGGMVSAVVTRECVRALLGLARVIENTGDFIAKIKEIQKRADQLRKMQKSFQELEEWTQMEYARLNCSLRTTIRKFSRPLMFHPTKPPDDIEDYVADIAKRLEETIKNAETNFQNTLNVIKKFRNKERLSSKRGGEKEIWKFTRAQAGHLIAISAVEKALQMLKSSLAFSPPPEWHKESEKWEKLEGEFKEASKQIHALLHPVKNFLASVLDSELATASGGSYGGWDVVAMACAAVAYGEVTGEWGDDRLCRVAELLKKVISNHGRFPIGRPYHVPGKGDFIPNNNVAIEALAQILKEVGIRAQHLKKPAATSVEPILVKKLLSFFRETRANELVDVNGKKKKGWSLDYRPPPLPTNQFATATAAQSLALINQMLNEQINAQILQYFSVKQPMALSRGPDLDTLFYPDYGLYLSFKTHKDLKDLSRKESIAIFLQKMCVHVASLKDSDKLYSLVLHGPQGTGKTTMVEALALSCNVPLVEVTPSDIVVRGEEAVERRARTVFEALSLLTRVVILFDEFDPVLWRRKPSGGRASNVFAFLTPGMLPKLKTLHRSAGKQSVAYVLITNLIGGLDEPAVREGRFDEKVGIYPPDLLSRAGRFLSEATVLGKPDLPKDESSKVRLREIMEISCGAGMQALNREGNFRRPDDNKNLQKGTLLYYYLGGDSDSKPSPLGQDAHFDKGKTNGSGPDADLEYKQWGWVDECDNEFKKKVTSMPSSSQPLFEALRNPPKTVPLPPSPKPKRSIGSMRFEKV